MELKEVNVFDFDKTIYIKDSEEQFIKYLLKRKPLLYLFVPYFTYGFIKYKLGFCTRQRMKEYYYFTLKFVKDPYKMVEEFWDQEEKEMFPYYFDVRQDDDIVVSASNKFLLDPICKRLNIKNCITGDIDVKTAKFLIPDCKGEEKVRRLKEERPEVVINHFYSDSYTDTPLAKIAKHAHLISPKGELKEWENL